MARIRFHKNMFDENFYECEYDETKTLLQQIEDYSVENVYTEFYVECYDSETGETSYEPLVEGNFETSVMICVNGISVKEDYKVKNGDLVTVIYLPLGDPTAMQHAANVMSTIAGAAMIVFGIIACATGYGAVAGVPLIISGAMMVGGAVMSWISMGIQANTKQTSISLGSETGESSPDIKGASNELITGNPYPFVIGKHLITPQIVGAPYTEYSGIRGEGACIHVMYCLGYSPVFVSDLKLGDFVLTKNTKNLISGKFDDIDPYWEDNEIEIELIQGQPNFIGYSKNYPNVVVQEEVKSNILFIADSSVTELSKVVYKGRGFSNGYRTNTVVFTDSCPMKFTVVLDAPNGLYQTRNETISNQTNSVSYTAYSPLTLFYVIQWRFYDETKEPSKADGSDYDDWNNITSWNGRSCAVSLNQDLINADIFNHAGNSYDISVYNNFKNKVVCDFSSFSGKDYISQVRLCSTVTISKEDAKKIIDTKGPNKIKSIEVRVLRVSPCYIDQETVANITGISLGPWSYCDIINLDLISTTRFDETELKDNDVYKAEAVQSKKDFDKFSYISLKAKADSNGTLQGQLKEFNCVVQSFSPIWNNETKEWLPKGVQRETYYYGYGEKLLTQPDDWTQNYTDYLIFDDVNSRFVKNNSLDFVVGTHYKPADMSSKYKEAFVDKDLYEEFRQKGFNWHRWQKGSNYIEKIRSEIFNDKVDDNYYLPESAEKYLNNSSASGFMLACVGPQNGPVAFGYNEINLLSVTDWYENSLGVEDGSLDIDNNPVKIDFCANGYIYDRTKLEDLLKQIAFTGRATYTYDETGKIKIIMDKPIDYPVGVINQQNCKEFSIFYNYNTLPAGFRVGFNDENDGYLNNSFTCWSDGNSESNYKGQVEPYQIPFVTNPVQCWSLMRYLLAIRCFQRETVIAKLGISSTLYSLGDVVAIASDELLIGDGSSRVQSPIQDGEYIYGLILDSTYHYDGDIDSDGRCTQGISVFQAEKYGKSRLVTFRLAKDGETQCGYTLRKGTTNIVLFETPVLRDFSNDPSAGLLKYSFNTGDICLLGLAEATYSRYIITKIKTDRNNSVSYTLMNYDESFYKYGEKLPVFKKNMASPKLLQKPLTFSEVPTTIRELNERIVENKDKIEVITPLPTTPVLSSVKATKDSLQILFNKSEISNFSNLIIEISKDEGITYSQSYVVYDDGVHPFDRELDGYPEKEDLDRWRIRAKSVNAYGKQSLNYSSAIPIDVTDYGTWKLAAPKVFERVKDRSVILDFRQPVRSDNREVYGDFSYGITVMRPDIDEVFYTPNESADPYSSETAYKIEDSYSPIFKNDIYVQIMPLQGQDTQNINHTQYKFKVVAKNEAGTSDPTEITVIARATSLDDFVNANATVKEAIVKELSALSANLGEVSGSLYGNELNYWTLAEIANGRHKRGAFRVGDENQGILIIPPFDTAEGIVNDTPNVRMVLKAGVFELSSTDSKINGELFIQKDKKSLYRARISPNGIFFEWRASVNDAWQEVTHQDISGTKTPSVQSDHSMIITNANMAQRRLNGSDIGVPIPTGASVYHFDTDKFDQHQKDTLTILESETGVQSVLKGAGDAEEQAGITDFTPALLAISPYSTVAKTLFGNYSVEKIIDTSNNWTVEFWLKFAWNESQTIFNFTTNNQTLSLKVLNDEPYYNNPLSTEPSYNYETTKSQKLVYNEIKRNSTELQHTTLSGTDTYLLLDHGIVFSPNEWYHFAISSTDSLFCVIINDKLIQLKKQQFAEPIQLTMNPSKGLFVLDELLISPIEAVSVDELIENYTRRIPYGSLDYKEKHFVVDVNDSKVWTNFLVPTGTILSGLYTKAPSGFLFFDGSDVAIKDYPQLYATVGTLPAFKSEKEGYFKLPDLTGKFKEVYVTSAFNVDDAIASTEIDGTDETAGDTAGDTVQPAALTVRYIIKY